MGSVHFAPDACTTRCTLQCTSLPTVKETGAHFQARGRPWISPHHVLEHKRELIDLQTPQMRAHTETSASRQTELARRRRATKKQKKQRNKQKSEVARMDGVAEGGTACESGKCERDASVRCEGHMLSHAMCCMLSAAPRWTLCAMHQVVYCVLICPDVRFGALPMPASGRAPLIRPQASWKLCSTATDTERSAAQSGCTCGRRG